MVVVVQTDAINTGTSAVDTVVVGMVSSTATQKNNYCGWGAARNFNPSCIWVSQDVSE